jgi:uncharacterized protein (TIGR00106 family)
MVIAQISVVPVGTGMPSVSRYVARAIRSISEETNIKYQLTGMGTILEGELTAVMEAVRKMHESVFIDQIKRVVTTVIIDDRRDRESSIERKVESVSEKLTRP